MKRREFVSGIGAGFVVLGAACVEAAIQLPDYNMPEEFLPREVQIKNDFAPGEIHVDPAQFALYWTMPDQKAIRYAIGIGRPGLYEAGEFYIGAKKEWPSWTPTPEMIERNPKYAEWEDGMPGGPGNPLGARALYLFRPNGGDSMLRIHGTNQPKTILTRVSNGCARLTNGYMTDLYDRVPKGTAVHLYPMTT